MPLSAEEVAAVVGELKDPLAGARVENARARDPRSIVLTLRPRRTSSLWGPPGARQKLFLLASARPGCARLHLVLEPPAAPAEPGSFAHWLRERIRGGRVIRVRLPGRGRAVEVDLGFPPPSALRPGGAAPAPGEPGAPRRLKKLILVAELGARFPNLLLLDGGRRLLGSLAPVKIRTEEGAREMLPAERYAPEGREAPPALLSGLTGSPWRYLPRDEEGKEPAPSLLQELCPLNLALGRYYERAEAALLLEERRAALRRELSAAVSKRRRLLQALAGDLEEARAGEGSLRLGELLKAELPRLKRGMDRVEVVDYYSPDLPRISVPLDPERSPKENIERFFQRYKKSERAVPVIEERFRRVEAEAARLGALRELLEGAQDEEAVRRVEEAARPHLPRPPPPPGGSREGGGGSAPSVRGPRRFLSKDGLEILVGRSGRENDELVFRIARGNDLFLHVAGSPGAHVVVRTGPGGQVGPETLLDAAHLALHYSRRGRRSAVEETASGDVDYVEVKHVKKPRGAKPGAVLLARHKTIRVKIERERLERLRGGGDSF
jgi:predicted ribosome quality control (RQC) complex YloA/Tae2 family protein